MFYKDWINTWITAYVSISSKESTLMRYRETANRYIIPVMGECEIDEISVIEIQRYVTELLARGLSTNSVNLVISVMQGSLRVAYETGVAKDYIGGKIRRPRNYERVIECFTREEQEKIERYIKDKGRQKLYGIMLCLYTGVTIH